MAQKSLALLVLITCSLAATGPVMGDGPFDSFLPFRRVEANPSQMYYVTEKQGPWMIMCVSFAGPLAQRQARELVLEMRRKHSIEAYVFRGHFDFTQSEMGKGYDRFGNRQKMKNLHGSQFDEYAVLAGNFSSIRDTNAQATLKKIKTIIPDTLNPKKNKQTSQRYAIWRSAVKRIKSTFGGEQEVVRRGPMAKAFMTRNPLLLDRANGQYQDQAFLMEINRGVKHSLLNNRQPYTVRVASFRGQVLIDLEKDFSKKKDKMTSKLEEAAMKAHTVATELRRLGYEAYEFHDRHESVVTIGGFPEVGRPRRDGKLELHPGIVEIMNKFSAKPSQGLGKLDGSLRPQMVKGITLDIQPVPVAVPRISVAVQATQSRWRR